MVLVFALEVRTPSRRRFATVTPKYMAVYQICIFVMNKKILKHISNWH